LQYKMSNNNPYINAYLQQQEQGRPVHPQQSVYQVPVAARPPQEYVPQYAMRSPVIPVTPIQPPQQVIPPVSQQIPREYTQFPTQQPQQQQLLPSATGGKDAYSGLNVFDQQVMKHSLEAEKVAAVDRRTFESQISTAQRSREEIDRQLAVAKTAAAAVAPATIKVEKKPIDDLGAISARRNQEAAQLKVEKVTNDASALLGAMAVKKTDASQLNLQMDELIKRRQMEMQNIQYK
jgi:uncharacterized cupredoxin-like copper-binding protein